MGQIPRSTLITQSKRRAALHTHPAFAGSWEREVTQQSRRPFAQTGLSPGTRNSHGYEVRVAVTDGGVVRLRRLLRSAKALKNGGVWYEVITGTWPSVTCPIMTHELTSLPPPTVQNGAMVRFFFFATHCPLICPPSIISSHGALAQHAFCLPPITASYFCSAMCSRPASRGRVPICRSNYHTTSTRTHGCFENLAL